MDAENLKQEARRAWYEYGEAIKEAFGFPEESHIVAETLIKVIRDQYSANLKAQSFRMGLNFLRPFSEARI